MKLKLFLIAASAMALASCSSDEVVQSNENANAIKFSVVANNGSRAADSWCNNKKPDQFHVWAAVNGKTYFENESFSLQGSSWQIDGDLRYWPEKTTPVSFYAAKIKADGGSTNFADFVWNPEGGSTIKMTTNAEASKQNDLLYAHTVQTRPAYNAVEAKRGVVPMNFRHALSQIVFYAQNLNENIYVTIDEVQVCNIKTKGIFKFNTGVTDTNVQEHGQGGDLDPVSTSVGSWEVTNLGDYGKQVVSNATTEKFTAVSFEQGGASQKAAVSLTDNTDSESKHDFAHSLLLIPQEVAAWNPATNPDPDKQAVGNEGEPGYVAGQTGAYFKVKCNIQNVAAGNGTAATKDDVCLWGTKTVTPAAGEEPEKVTLGTSYIYLPVNIAWQTGRKYIYTFKFMEDGHGGYTEDGEDVLIPIKFDVTVDDFAEETDTPIYIDKAPANP